MNRVKFYNLYSVIHLNCWAKMLATNNCKSGANWQMWIVMNKSIMMNSSGSSCIELQSQH